MSPFILVHGAFHGAWCWYRLLPALQRRGRRGIATDLPGHGLLPAGRKTHLAATMEAYVEQVCALIDAEPGPVVLVGHSMGAGVVSQVMQRRAERIERVVFISGLLAPDGQSLFATARTDTDPQALLSSNLVLSDDRRTVSVRPQAAAEVFYGGCSDDDRALAALLLSAQATAPLQATLSVDASLVARVPKTYLRCLQDRTFSPAFQARCAATLQCERVVDLDRGHSPFLSAPDELAGLLVSA